MIVGFKDLAPCGILVDACSIRKILQAIHCGLVIKISYCVDFQLAIADQYSFLVILAQKANLQ
jgi:hypothetical protein